jgi:hypothetical protein
MDLRASNSTSLSSGIILYSSLSHIRFSNVSHVHVVQFSLQHGTPALKFWQHIVLHSAHDQHTPSNTIGADLSHTSTLFHTFRNIKLIGVRCGKKERTLNPRSRIYRRAESEETNTLLLKFFFFSEEKKEGIFRLRWFVFEPAKNTRA